MRMATVGRLKPLETDILHDIHHPRRRRPLSPRWLPDLFLSSFIPDGDIVPEKDFSDSEMLRGPTVFDSMFHPDLFSSMFDIRPGRRRHYELPSLHSHDTPFNIPSAGKSTDFKKPVSPSSNVRVIPIKVEHGPRQLEEKRTPSSSVANSGKKSPNNTIILDSDSQKSNADVHSVDSKRLKNPKSSKDKYIVPDDDTDFPVIIDDNECIQVPITVISDTAQSDSPSKCTLRTSSSRLLSSGSKAEVQNSVANFTKSPLISKNTNSNNNSSRKQNVPLSSSDSRSLSAVDDANDDDIGASFCSPLESRDPSFSCLPTAYAEECESVSEEHEVNPAPSYPIYDVLKVRLARENRKIDYIRGDGNCFFRALSKQLYGTERFHKAARSLIVDIIATNKPRFEPFVDKENVQEHVERMSEDHCWATTCEIYAAATLLQRDIYMLTPDHLNETYSWLLFKPIFTSTQQLYEGTHHPCYITMCNTNGNHYDRVVPDHGGCNCFAPHPALDGISANVDLTS